MFNNPTRPKTDSRIKIQKQVKVQTLLQNIGKHRQQLTRTKKDSSSNTTKDINRDEDLRKKTTIRTITKTIKVIKIIFSLTLQCFPDIYSN